MIRWALAPLRTVFALFVVALVTIVLGSYVIVLARISPRSRQITPIMRAWATTFLFVAGARVTVEGRERLDPAVPYVFSGNHISSIEIPVMIGLMPVSVRFLAKKELFGVPVLGPAMKAIHMVRTDRQAAGIAHRAIHEQVAKVVEEGLSLVIYPEGTRSKDAELMPFKKGAFRIAIDNGMAIVPVTITGSERVWPPGSKLIYGGPVRVVVHEPISTDGMTAADIDPLRDRVRAIVADTYEKIRGS
jgi:1-acyl-sn-glycerol-3-phosphate acyltransferase